MNYIFRINIELKNKNQIRIYKNLIYLNIKGIKAFYRVDSRYKDFQRKNKNENKIFYLFIRLVQS